jgi:hypothetical protein
MTNVSIQEFQDSLEPCQHGNPRTLKYQPDILHHSTVKYHFIVASILKPSHSPLLLHPNIRNTESWKKVAERARTSYRRRRRRIRRRRRSRKRRRRRRRLGEFV